MKKILILLFPIIFISCGARKSEVKKSEKEIKAEVKENEKTETTTDVVYEQYMTIEEDEATLTPINPEKPIEIVKPDGKKTTVLNAKIDYKKSSAKQEVKEQAKTVQVKEKKTESNVESREVVKEKITDRKQYYIWVFWLIIVIAILYIIYRKIKNKISI